MPANLSLDYPAPGAGFAALWGLALAGLILAAILCLIALSVRGYPAEAFFSTWILSALLPVSNIVPAGAYVAERFLFLPSAAFATLLALYMSGLAAFRGKLLRPIWGHRLPAFAAALIIASFGGMTLFRSADWTNEERLWAKTASIFPTSYKAYTGIGAVHSSNKNYDKAAHNFLGALTIWPGYGPARANMAKLFIEKNFFQRAELLLRGNLVQNLHRAGAITGIGAIYASSGLWAKALEQYRKAYIVDERDPQINYNLAFVLSKLGHVDKPVALYLSAINIKGDHWEAMNNLGNFYRAKRLQVKAMAAYRAAARLAPDSPLPLIGLGAVHAEMREFARAQEV